MLAPTTKAGIRPRIVVLPRLTVSPIWRVLTRALGCTGLVRISLRPVHRQSYGEKKIAYGFENAVNYSRDDFHEDGHDTTIRLLARHALFITMRVPLFDATPCSGGN
jgi:hypothetical protein